MNMFKPTSAKTPAEYISQIDEPRQSQIQHIHEFICSTLPKQKAFIISGMIGYGKYHYKYASGREGDWALVLLASQKNYISIYVCSMYNDEYIAETYKKDMPKASIGKSCIRFKKFEDIDFPLLKKVLLEAQQRGGMGVVS